MTFGMTIIAVASLILSSFLAVKAKNIKDENLKIKDDNFRLQNKADNAIKAARKQIREENADHLRKLEADFRKYRKNYQAQFEIDNVHTVSQAIAGQQFQELDKRFQALINHKFKRISQDFIANTNENLEQTSIDFEVSVTEKIWDAYQQFKGDFKETPTIFPTGVKLAYTKGHRTVMVLEQQPQTRSVVFEASLLKPKVINAAKAQTNHGYRFNLAFPYVYFVIVFDDEEYAYHQVYFRNKPLTSIREHVYLAPLPNIWRDKGNNYKPMCMGASFQVLITEEKTMARQAEYVISEFWQRPFTNDLGTGISEKGDKRVSNYAIWQSNTEKNEFFILDVSWEKGKTIKGIVEAALNLRETTHPSDKIDTMIRNVIDKNIKVVSKQLVENVKNADLSLSLSEDNKEIKDELECLLIDHAKEVFKLCNNQ